MLFVPLLNQLPCIIRTSRRWYWFVESDTSKTLYFRCYPPFVFPPFLQIFDIRGDLPSPAIRSWTAKDRRRNKGKTGGSSFSANKHIYHLGILPRKILDNIAKMSIMNLMNWMECPRESVASNIYWGISGWGMNIASNIVGCLWLMLRQTKVLIMKPNNLWLSSLSVWLGDWISLWCLKDWN